MSVEEGQKLAQEYDIQFFETSAKNDIEVDSVRVLALLEEGFGRDGWVPHIVLLRWLTDVRGCDWLGCGVNGTK